MSDAIRAKYDQVKATTYRAGTPAERMKEGKLDGLNTALAVAMVVEDRLAALHPQPSGETREAVRLAMEDADALERVSEEADDNQWPDWAATMRQAASRIRQLALLSARPLALGGQHSGGEGLYRVGEFIGNRPVLCQHGNIDPNNLCAYCEGDEVYPSRPDTTPARAEAQDEDTPCTDCGDTGVTHQTERRCSCQEAEAQDEGAAGKWPEVTDQWAETYCDLTGQNPDGAQVSFIGDGAVTTTFRDKAKRQIEAMLCAAPKAAVRAISAHPSPTPAADADRVREAIEKLEWRRNGRELGAIKESLDTQVPSKRAEYKARVLSNALVEVDYDALCVALAALKSTAAKEGGK